MPARPTAPVPGIPCSANPVGIAKRPPVFLSVVLCPATTGVYMPVAHGYALSTSPSLRAT
jgi:hypothetical protein